MITTCSYNQYISAQRLTGTLYCRRLTEEQQRYLTDEDTLRKWLPFNLKQRVLIANKLFKDGPKITERSLRELYARHSIKPRKLKIDVAKSTSTLERIHGLKLGLIENMCAALERKDILLFLDECVFTNRSIVEKVWSKSHFSATIQKKRLGFKAIGVVGAIDTTGRLVALKTSGEWVKLDDLREISRQIK